MRSLLIAAAMIGLCCALADTSIETLLSRMVTLERGLAAADARVSALEHDLRVAQAELQQSRADAMRANDRLLQVIKDHHCNAGGGCMLRMLDVCYYALISQ